MQAVVDSPVEGKLSPSQLNMFEGFSYGTRNVLVTDQRVGHCLRLLPALSLLFNLFGNIPLIAA